MKICVISLSVVSTSKDCDAGLVRLEESLRRVGFSGDIIFWRNRYPDGCPTHLQSPFAFKTFCFMESRAKGYDIILWMDASVVALKPLDAIIDAADKSGYLFFRNNPRWSVAQWCSDEALAALDVDRQDLMELSEMATVALALNMRDPVAIQFLEQWHEKARDGISFRGVREPLLDQTDYEEVKWNKNNRASNDSVVLGHRHDQTVAGILAHRLGMKLTSEGIVEELYSSAREKKPILFVKRKKIIPLRTILLIIKYWPLISRPLWAWRRAVWYGNRLRAIALRTVGATDR